MNSIKDDERPGFNAHKVWDMNDDCECVWKLGIHLKLGIHHRVPYFQRNPNGGWTFSCQTLGDIERKMINRNGGF